MPTPPDPDTPQTEKLYNFVTLLKAAQKEVAELPYWKKFIDGTPLSNDFPTKLAQWAQRNCQAFRENEIKLIRIEEAFRETGKFFAGQDVVVFARLFIRASSEVIKEREAAIEKLASENKWMRSELISIARVYCDTDPNDENQGGLHDGIVYALLEGTFDTQEDRHAEAMARMKEGIEEMAFLDSAALSVAGSIIREDAPALMVKKALGLDESAPYSYATDFPKYVAKLAYWQAKALWDERACYRTEKSRPYSYEREFRTIVSAFRVIIDAIGWKLVPEGPGNMGQTVPEQWEHEESGLIADTDEELASMSAELIRKGKIIPQAVSIAEAAQSPENGTAVIYQYDAAACCKRIDEQALEVLRLETEITQWKESADRDRERIQGLRNQVISQGDKLEEWQAWADKLRADLKAKGIEV